MRKFVSVIVLATILALCSTACLTSNSAGAANLVSITAPDAGGEGWNMGFDESLVVKLKPNSTTQSNTSYTVDLYEKGKLRATSSVSWSDPDFNMKNAQYVHFPLSDAEFQAYSKGRLPTRDEWLKTGNSSIYKNLQETFSVKVH
jgi:hypothetical protein